MAAFETLANTTYASRTNTTVSAPAGVADGDVLLGVIITALSAGPPDAPDPTFPSGFVSMPGAATMLFTEIGGFQLEMRVVYKVASGEPGTYTFTHAAANSQAVMMRFSAVDTTTPVDVNSTGDTGSASTSTVPSLTTVTDGAMVVWVGYDWADNANNLTPPAGTTPTFTERLDLVLTYVATGVLATAGATGARSMTNNASGAGGWGATMVALRPGSAPAWPPLDTPPGAPLRVSSTARIS